MIAALLAYFAGKDAGMAQRQPGRKSRIAQSDVRLARIAAAVIAVCVLVVLLFASM